MTFAKIKTLVLSTRNAHKTTEIRALLPPEMRIFTLDPFPSAPKVIEDAGTFSGNATKKAVELAEWIAGSPDRLNVLGLDGRSPGGNESFVLADDSGLEVDALGGAPGVFSARFAAVDNGHENSPDSANNAKLLKLLSNVPVEKRTARFRCVIALAPVLLPGARTESPACALNETEFGVELFDGACEGRIGFEHSGEGGFGYDPLFIPDGFDKSFAELGESIKNGISHRAKALAKLRERFGG